MLSLNVKVFSLQSAPLHGDVRPSSGEAGRAGQSPTYAGEKSASVKISLLKGQKLMDSKPIIMLAHVAARCRTLATSLGMSWIEIVFPGRLLN